MYLCTCYLVFLSVLASPGDEKVLMNPIKADSIGAKGSIGLPVMEPTLTAMNKPTRAKYRRSPVPIRVKRTAANRHSFVATEGFMISVSAGFHSPRMSLAMGVINADPLPLMTAMVTGTTSGEFGKANLPSSSPAKTFLALEIQWDSWEKGIHWQLLIHL